jgi:hypothetical protein
MRDRVFCRRFVSLCLSATVVTMIVASPSVYAADIGGYEFIAIDRETESALGRFPISRAYYASLIEKLSAAGAKAVVFKMFFDLKQEDRADMLFASGIRDGGMPVVLQANLRVNEKSNGRIMSDYSSILETTDLAAPQKRKNGWIPLDSFQTENTVVAASDDYDLNQPEHVKFLYDYDGSIVPSIYLAAISLRHGLKFRIDDQAIFLGHAKTSADDKNDVSLDVDVNSYRLQFSTWSMSSVLNGVNMSGFRDKVVIVMYTGSREPRVTINGQEVPGHLIFIARLIALDRRFRP